MSELVSGANGKEKLTVRGKDDFGHTGSLYHRFRCRFVARGGGDLSAPRRFLILAEPFGI